MHNASDTAPRLERLGYTALLALLLAPVVAHGAWRPLGHLLGQSGDAVAVTAGALLIALAGTLVGGPKIRLALGGLVAAAVGVWTGAAAGVALAIVAVAVVALSARLAPLLPAELDGLLFARKGLSALYVALALLSVISVARLSTFIGDPTRVDLQALPGDAFVERHSCLTAYVRAAELVADPQVENFYEDRWWAGSLGLPPKPTDRPDPYAPFAQDNFSYPPSFLLLMEPLRWLEGDFWAQRALWFGGNALVAAIGIGAFAAWIGGARALRAVLLAPLLFASAPVLITLQIGNFHLATLALSLLAMLAFDQRRERLGGLLLAITILAKISPGVFGIVLLAQRRYREAIWTAIFGGLLLGISLLAYGVAPLRYFVSFAMPRLSSGAAFPHITTLDGILTNISPFGFAYKLQALGVEVGDPLILASRLGKLYTLWVVAMAVASGLRRGDRRDQALRWMALITLAAMQSPFSAGYALIGLLWATTLWAVEIVGTGRGIALALLCPALVLQLPGIDPALRIGLGMAQTCLAIGVSSWLILRAPRA